MSNPVAFSPRSCALLRSPRVDLSCGGHRLRPCPHGGAEGEEPERHGRGVVHGEGGHERADRDGGLGVVRAGAVLVAALVRREEEEEEGRGAAGSAHRGNRRCSDFELASVLKNSTILISYGTENNYGCLVVSPVLSCTSYDTIIHAHPPVITFEYPPRFGPKSHPPRSGTSIDPPGQTF